MRSACFSWKTLTRKLDNSAISWAINSSPAMIQIRQIDVVGRVAAVEQGWFKASSPSPTSPSSSFSTPRDMAEDGRKRFRDRRAAARVNNGTTSFREARRRWTSTRVYTCVYAWGAYWVRSGGGNWGRVRRNNPLAKHRNINQHQSLERGPLAPTLRYCLHLHSTGKKIMTEGRWYSTTRWLSSWIRSRAENDRAPPLSLIIYRAEATKNLERDVIARNLSFAINRIVNRNCETRQSSLRARM